MTGLRALCAAGALLAAAISCDAGAVGRSHHAPHRVSAVYIGYACFWHIVLRRKGGVTETTDQCAAGKAQSPRKPAALGPMSFQALLAAARQMGFYGMPAIVSRCSVECYYRTISIGSVSVSSAPGGSSGVARRFESLFELFELASHVRFSGRVPYVVPVGAGY